MTFATDPRDERGRDSAAGQLRPSQQPAALPLKPSERYLLIAHRLGTSPREAELLWHLARRAPMVASQIGDRMGTDNVSPRVSIYRLRKRGINVLSDPYVGYSLELADRVRVLAAASVAPSSGALPSEDSSQATGGRANAVPTFQPADDLTRQPAQHVPCHSVPASFAGPIDQQESGTCIPSSGTLHP